MTLATEIVLSLAAVVLLFSGIVAVTRLAVGRRSSTAPSRPT